MSVQLNRNLSQGAAVPVGVSRSVVTIALPGVRCGAACLAVSAGAQSVCCTEQKATREEEPDGARTSIDDQDESNCESTAISDKEEAGSCAAQDRCVPAESSELRWDVQVPGVRAHVHTRGCAGRSPPSSARRRRHICQCRQCVAPAQDDGRWRRRQRSRQRCERGRSEPLFDQPRRPARVGLPGRHSCERNRDQSREQLARRSGTPRPTSLAPDPRLRAAGHRATTAHSRENGPAKWATRDSLKPAALQGSSRLGRLTAHSRDLTGRAANAFVSPRRTVRAAFECSSRPWRCLGQASSNRGANCGSWLLPGLLRFSCSRRSS